jgi:ABC-type sugar transport system ATPase subunit
MARSDLPDDNPLLRMTRVRKRFGATIALDGVDLYVRRAKSSGLSARTGPGNRRS